MAYDRADWHYGGDFPAGLPRESGGTHIGMFLAWAIMNHLEGDFHREESPAALDAVRGRRMTGRQFLFKECDEKFWEEDLSEEGNAFARAYYGGGGEAGEYFSAKVAEGVTAYARRNTGQAMLLAAAVGCVLGAALGGGHGRAREVVVAEKDYPARGDEDDAAAAVSGWESEGGATASRP